VNGYTILLMAGMFEPDGAARGNSVVLIPPEGRLPGKYRKQHLKHELERNRPGSKSPVFDTPCGRIRVTICADRKNYFHSFSEFPVRFVSARLK